MSSTLSERAAGRRLAGKVAIVTGVATGLGREIALLYAEEGANVVGCDVRASEGADAIDAIRAAGGTGLFVRADVTRAADMYEVVARAEATYGAVHVMTANAGALGRGAWKPLIDLSEEEIEEAMAVNFGGTCLSFRAAIPAIVRAGGGSMTVTTSEAAHRGYARLPIYSAAKGAVVALVRSLAVDLAPLIRVNAVSAGPMRTLIREHYLEETGASPSGDEQPGTSRAHPRVVAQVHLFLASEESAYINGQALLADGGRTMRAPE